MVRTDSTLPTVSVCGFNVLAGTYDEVKNLLLQRIQGGQGARVITLNVQMLAWAKVDRAYAELLAGADLIVADGMPIVWACRKKAPDLTIERVAGVDLTEDLLRSVPADQIGIVGGVDPRAALNRLKLDESRQIQIENGKIVPEAEAMQAWLPQMHDRPLLFVALGVPKQDSVAQLLRTLAPGSVTVAVGGSFEMLAGMVPRAPGLLQRIGLEWLFRLCNEPRRLWRRILIQYWPGVFALLKDQDLAHPASSTASPDRARLP